MRRPRQKGREHSDAYGGSFERRRSSTRENQRLYIARSLHIETAALPWKLTDQSIEKFGDAASVPIDEGVAGVSAGARGGLAGAAAGRLRRHAAPGRRPCRR